MLECQASTSEGTSAARSTTSSAPTQTTATSTKTSPLASTGRGPDLLPYWTASTKEVSERLWWPTKTDSQGSGWSSSSGSSDRLMQNSWFSATKSVAKANPSASSPTTSSPSSPSLSQSITDDVLRTTEGSVRKPLPPLAPPKRSKKKKQVNPSTPEKPPPGKAKRIRVYPTTEEQEKLKRWIGTARWTYNECLKAIQNEGVARSKKALRARALNEGTIVALNKPWLRDTPYDVRDAAMDDLLKAYASGFARRKNDKKSFKLGLRSRKTAFQESIVVHHKHYKNMTGTYAFLKKLRSAEPLPEDLIYDSRLVLERRTNAFYLCIPMPLVVRSENQAPATKRIIALDPGVRTFMTSYDPSGESIDFAAKDIGHIYRLCHRLDDLQSKWDAKEVRHHQRWSMRKAGVRMRRRIRHLVDDLHCKLAKYLCETYSVVLLPKFETQGMIRRGQRRIRSKTARAMCTLSHYRFQRRLIDKAREYPWCRVVIVSEAYTSKTCGRCGKIHAKLGGNKVFRCPSCQLECDRDKHAARNILLRYLTTSRWPLVVTLR
jgi:putative transposase